MLFPDLRIYKRNVDDFYLVDEEFDDQEYFISLNNSVSEFTPKSILKPTSEEKQQIITFTNWCNFHLLRSNNQIKNFEQDFRNGHNLLFLLQALTDDSIPVINNIDLNADKLANVNKCLYYLEKNGCYLSFISAEDIVAGNIKITLALIWSIILHFTIKTINYEEFSAKRALLEWCRQTTNDYKNVRIENFDLAFRDGLALCAIIHFHASDSIDFYSLRNLEPEINFNLALEICERIFGVPKMLSINEISRNQLPDEKCIMTYVASMYHAIHKSEKKHTPSFLSIKSDTKQRLEKSLSSDKKITSIAGKFENTLEKKNKLNDELNDYLEQLTGDKKNISPKQEINSMSRHYEERYYVKDERDLPDYEHRNRSTSRARSSSRHTSRHRQEDPYYRQRSGSGSSCSSMSDYEGRDRPLVRCPRDVIRAPTPPPVIQRVVERAPTPEADVVERVIVRPQPQQLIERIIERPRTPPPRIIDKEICEPAPPPIVRTRIVKVDHSPKHYYQNQCSRNYMPISSRYDDYDTGSYSTAEAYPQPSYQTAAYPSQAYPSQPYPSQAYPSQAYPSQPYPSQAHPSQAYPSQAYPSQAHPSQAYPTQAYQGQASGSAYQQPPQQYYSHAGSSPYGYGASNYPQGSSRRY